ncbi:hypothetical protein BRC70_02960 [Halobacteriales archaeon QH_6_68_27]|nr:MAG: hypothetical protein BRC70_02960 [Halobacteriales archaeon QH_6_68_27]
MPERGETGSAGRFGARYGRVARRRVAEIEGEMREDHECPECGEDRVDRAEATVTVTVTAADLVALRAGVNTWLGLVAVAEECGRALA